MTIQQNFRSQSMLAILRVEIRFEQDVVLARQRAGQIASQLDFAPQEQTRIATAVSEIARNALNYAGGGKVEFLMTRETPVSLLIRVSDNGSGIANLEMILNGQYQSQTGKGLGIIGAKRLMDDVRIYSEPNYGTRVELIKFLPRQANPLSLPQIKRLVDNLLEQNPQNPYAEIQQQNQELLQTFGELRQRQEELAQLNQELEHTNRGVIALYAELNDRAEYYQTANELKNQFFSHLTHEFRTPLNGILGLSDMLLRRFDGDLTTEQEKQISLIRSAAATLSELVNDLLDLAKIEAGKIEVKATSFRVTDLFATLRGILRPLIEPNAEIELVFEDATSLPMLHTDESKVSQILRNFISNALKFTERGEVRVSAQLGIDDTIAFAIADTGIGIAPKDRQLIFEEFVQIDCPLQRKVKGTGLGLALSKKLAEFLGGSIEVESTLNVGSTFSLTLPRIYINTKSQQSNQQDKVQRRINVEPSEIGSQENFQGDRIKILSIDDDSVFRYTLRSLLNRFSCMVIEAEDGYEGLFYARTEQPNAIVLDLNMPRIDGLKVLLHLKSDPLTKSIPVIMMTSKAVEASEIEQFASNTVAILSKQTDSLEKMFEQLKLALKKAGLELSN
jgi:signal transduction histidine kinase/ActR/RegA family two-component response regulator